MYISCIYMERFILIAITEYTPCNTMHKNTNFRLNVWSYNNHHILPTCSCFLGSVFVFPSGILKFLEIRGIVLTHLHKKGFKIYFLFLYYVEFKCIVKIICMSKRERKTWSWKMASFMTKNGLIKPSGGVASSKHTSWLIWMTIPSTLVVWINNINPRSE